MTFLDPDQLREIERIRAYAIAHPESPTTFEQIEAHHRIVVGSILAVFQLIWLPSEPFEGLPAGPLGTGWYRHLSILDGDGTEPPRRSDVELLAHAFGFTAGQVARLSNHGVPHIVDIHEPHEREAGLPTVIQAAILLGQRRDHVIEADELDEEDPR